MPYFNHVIYTESQQGDQSQLDLQRQLTAAALKQHSSDKELQEVKASFKLARKGLEGTINELQTHVMAQSAELKAAKLESQESKERLEELGSEMTSLALTAAERGLRVKSMEKVIERVMKVMHNNWVAYDTLTELVNPHQARTAEDNNKNKKQQYQDHTEQMFTHTKPGLTRTGVNIPGSPFQYDLELGADTELIGPSSVDHADYDPEEVKVINARVVSTGGLGRAKGSGMRQDCLSTSITIEQLEQSASWLQSEAGQKNKNGADINGGGGSELLAGVRSLNGVAEHLCVVEINGNYII